MRKPPFVIRFLLVFVSIALSLCLFVSALAAILILNIRSAVDTENLQELVDSTILSDTEISSPVADELYGFVQESLGSENPISREQFDTFWEESTVKDFVSEEAADILSDLCTGKDTASVTADELAALVEENKALIETYFGITVTDDTVQSVKQKIAESDIVNKLSREGIQTMLGAEDSEPVCTGLESVKYVLRTLVRGEEPHLPTMLEAVRFFTSDKTLYTVLGVCAALFLLLLAANCFRLPMGLVFSGVPLICAGMLMLIPSALSTIFSAFLDGMAKTILSHFYSVTAPAGTIVFMIGIVLIVAGVVVRILRPHKIRP